MVSVATSGVILATAVMVTLKICMPKQPSREGKCSDLAVGTATSIAVTFVTHVDGVR